MTPPPDLRARPARSLVLLLLVLVFCASAVVGTAVLDDSSDSTSSSTRVLTPEERIPDQDVEVATAADQPGQESGRSAEQSAPLALIALLLLVCGALFLTFAVPTRRERNRDAVAAPAVQEEASGFAVPTGACRCLCICGASSGAMNQHGLDLSR